MPLIIPELNKTRISHGMLIRITVSPGQVYYIANTYSPIVWEGNAYTALGHLLGTNEIQDDLRATNNQLQITLSGIPIGSEQPASYIAMMLDQPIKGSRVEIWRALFADNKDFLADQTSLRFSGYISNYVITDSSDLQNFANTRAITVMCSSVHAILERQLAGRRTNQTDQRARYPGDVSMDRVSAISNTAFDFGKPYTGGGTGGTSPPTDSGGYFDSGGSAG
jgi:hypothetical protein